MATPKAQMRLTRAERVKLYEERYRRYQLGELPPGESVVPDELSRKETP